MKREDDFLPKTIIKLAERAAYMCSNPACMRITVGPCDSSPTDSTKTGKAAHICAASKNGPRYNEYQTSNQRKSIENGIWLCGACADMIDKNMGRDYPEPKLKKWKRDHEKLMKSLVESGFNPLRKLSSQGADIETAEKLVKLLEDKGVLFVPYAQEDDELVVKSLDNLRSNLRGLRNELSTDSPLDARLLSMIDACRYYMNNNVGPMTPSQLEESLGELRKVFGIHLSQIKDQYNLTIKRPLSSILPEL
jgi:hypothetical protein